MILLLIVRGLHETFTPGKHSRLGAILQVQFAQNIADMALHRFLANHQAPGDLPIRAVGRDQVQHLTLPIIQKCVEGHVAMGRAAPFFLLLDQARRHMWMDRRLAPRGLAYGIRQFR
jgi:hypothetical protein